MAEGTKVGTGFIEIRADGTNVKKDLSGIKADVSTAAKTIQTELTGVGKGGPGAGLTNYMGAFRGIAVGANLASQAMTGFSANVGRATSDMTMMVAGIGQAKEGLSAIGQAAKASSFGMVGFIGGVTALTAALAYLAYEQNKVNEAMAKAKAELAKNIFLEPANAAVELYNLNKDLAKTYDELSKKINRTAQEEQLLLDIRQRLVSETKKMTMLTSAGGIGAYSESAPSIGGVNFAGMLGDSLNKSKTELNNVLSDLRGNLLRARMELSTATAENRAGILKTISELKSAIDIVEKSIAGDEKKAGSLRKVAAAATDVWDAIRKMNEEIFKGQFVATGGGWDYVNKVFQESGMNAVGMGGLGATFTRGIAGAGLGPMADTSMMGPGASNDMSQWMEYLFGIPSLGQIMQGWMDTVNMVDTMPLKEKLLSFGTEFQLWGTSIGDIAMQASNAFASFFSDAATQGVGAAGKKLLAAVVGIIGKILMSVGTEFMTLGILEIIAALSPFTAMVTGATVGHGALMLAAGAGLAAGGGLLGGLSSGLGGTSGGAGNSFQQGISRPTAPEAVTYNTAASATTAGTNAATFNKTSNITVYAMDADSFREFASKNRHAIADATLAAGFENHPVREGW